MKHVRCIFILFILVLNYSCSTIFNPPLDMNKINCTLLGNFDHGNEVSLLKIIFYEYDPENKIPFFNKSIYTGKFIGSKFFVNFDKPGRYFMGMMDGYYSKNMFKTGEFRVHFYDNDLQPISKNYIVDIKGSEVLYYGSFFIDCTPDSGFTKDKLLFKFSINNRISKNEIIDELNNWVIKSNLGNSWKKWIDYLIRSKD